MYTISRAPEKPHLTSTSVHGELEGEADEATLGVFDGEVACEAVGEMLRVAT